MKDVIYSTSDNSLEIRLQFITKRKLKYTYLGKSWPKHTQCLLFSNGLLKTFDTIIKHAKDTDNPAFAYRLVAENCLKSIKNKWLRTQVRAEVVKVLKELQAE